MKGKLLALLLAITAATMAQLKSDAYQWEETPIYDSLSADTSMHAVYHIKKYFKEFVYEEQDLVEYYLVHRKVKLLTKSALEGFKVVYIPKSEYTKIVREQARVIKPDGKLVRLNEDNIKEGIDEESGSLYRYFAFEDLAVGDEIEYLYSIRQSPYHYGIYYQVQSRYPTYNFEFELLTPPNLAYKFKLYNGLAEVELDTNYKDTNRWFLHIDTVTALKEERLSNYENDLQAFHFKLDKNIATGYNDITAFGPWAKNVYNAVYKLDKKQLAQIKKLIKAIKPDETSEGTKVRTVEDYIKKEFIYYDSDAPVLSDINSIIANKAFNNDGSVFLYANIFKQLGIPHEIIATTDRWDLRFDPEFESYRYLKDFLFYFPNIEKIMSGTSISSRLGFPPEEYTNNYGLFIKEVKLGEFEAGIGKVKFIDAVPMDKTLNKIVVNTKFNEDVAEVTLTTEHTYTGYDAVYYQPIFNLIKEPKDLDEFQKSIVNIFNIDGDPESFEIINDKAEDFDHKPLIVKSTYKTDQLTEKAGATYLYKIGRLIGPQMELYDTLEKRKEPFEFQYNRMYDRTLTVEIPDGYEVSNLNDLIFNASYTNEKSDTVFAFVSNYKIENQILTVSIREWYNGLNWPKELWDNYREVVNAAANFNKVNLVLVPKED
ncbi:MAG: DUF3857 domain-containing protein [Bacteroidales bacterium]|nr:DUF3857 domain-containing protein [Bacteroidales bacterium]